MDSACRSDSPSRCKSATLTVLGSKAKDSYVRPGFLASDGHVRPGFFTPEARVPPAGRLYPPNFDRPERSASPVTSDFDPPGKPASPTEPDPDSSVLPAPTPAVRPNSCPAPAADLSVMPAAVLSARSGPALSVMPGSDRASRACRGRSTTLTTKIAS